MSTGSHARWFRGEGAALVVAVCVARTGRAQFHAGLYHRDHGPAKVLHFAWDRELYDQTPDELFEERDYGLAALSLDDDDLQTLCALCRHVARTHAVTLRYRFVEWRPRFDLATAELIPAPEDPGYGFTCATFVLAMLRSAVVVDLLALEEWPVPAPGGTDEQWQRRLAGKLASCETSPQAVAHVLSGIGARRVLPTDVAGAATLPSEGWPVGFADARREGDQIARGLP